MLSINITCDQCGADLSHSEKVHYRIAVGIEHTFARIKEPETKPPFKDPHHFCNWKCLRDWVVSK